MTSPGYSEKARHLQPKAFVQSPEPLSRLVVPSSLRRQAVHDWFVFPHSFSPALVQSVVAALELEPDAVVGDPFVGSGTTLLAAQDLGFQSVGTDLMPLAVLSATVKTANVDAVNTAAVLKAMRPHPSREPIARFGTVTMAFDGVLLDELDGIVGWIQSLEPCQGAFFRLALAKGLESHSRLQKAGGWLKKVDASREEGPITPTFRGVAERMLHALGQRSSDRPRASVARADARALPWGDETVSAVVTSPPYLNKHDYTRVFCLELAIACGMTEQQIKDLRKGSLRSHVEAKGAPDEVAEPIKKVQQWLVDVDKDVNGRLHRTIEGYFYDLRATINEVRRVLRAGGTAVFVLGDVRFAGRVLPVGEIARDLASAAGLESVASQQARMRGNSAQQMKRHGRVAVPEWILVWRR